MQKLVSVLCAVLLIFSLCSCSAQDGQKQKDQKGQSGGIVYDDNSSDNGASSSKGLTMLCDNNTRQNHCNTENGYYYITDETVKLKDGTKAYHLMYVDFSTQQEIYLCSNSGCHHDTGSCTAVLPMDEFEFDSCIFTNQNALYILSRKFDNDGGSFSMQANGTNTVESSPAVLYRMGLNGEGREKVYSFYSNLTLEKSVLADENSLYMITKKLSSTQSGTSAYTTSSERQIVRLDISSWKAQTVCEVNFGYDNTQWKILGCYDKNIVVEGIAFDSPLTHDQQMDNDYYRQAYNNSKSIFATVDLTTGEFHEIYSLSNQSQLLHSAATQDGVLYLSLNTENSIHTFNLRTGQNSVLTELKQNNIYVTFAGMLCCSTWELKDDHTMYFVNMKTAEVTHSGLVTKTLGWRLELRGETQNEVLVIYDYDAKAPSIPQGEDVYEITKSKLALIDKDDFYNGVDNFHPIQSVKGE